jgi:OFA family oxalate/formate antiporter-like MFS transporter
MEKKPSISFGFRGTMLLICQFLAFFTFIVFTNWPMNILADMYGGAAKISTIYTVATVICIIAQLILSRFVGKFKSIKALSVIFGIIALIAVLGIMLIPPSQPALWQFFYFLVALFSNIYCTFALGILVGQWFPRRKGTVMGIATLAFPIGNGLIGAFAGTVFAKGYPDVFGAFLPYFIISLVGLLIGIIFITDYPEQVGAFRDNDKSITPEVAKAMLEQEIEAKKTTVWTMRNTFANRDFWFITIPMGALLMMAVGMTTQSMSIISTYPELPFAGVMAGVMIIACIGSWLLGVLDTKFGTKKAILISVIIMIISGVFGLFHSATTLLISIFCLAVFMGASSNFTVSAAAQYWRREDFSSVFARINPIANILQAIGPMLVAILLTTKGLSTAFGTTAVVGVISLVLIILFSPVHVKETDDKYRQAAGKPLDEALVGRK